VHFSNLAQIFRYREKSLQQRLEILYERNLYILAINLAQKIGINTLQQNAIYRKYGDFLYQRGDYDTAMQQYLRAIDNTEPSQVIRKVDLPLNPNYQLIANPWLSTLTPNASTT
jgi:tetratricopeptide (TPR) repeat protein